MPRSFAIVACIALLACGDTQGGGGDGQPADTGGDAQPADTGDTSEMHDDVEVLPCQSTFPPREGSGCASGEVCTSRQVCYPRAGLTPERCGSAARFLIELGPPSPIVQDNEREVTGRVSEHGPGRFTVESSQGLVEFTYDIGVFRLPIEEGQQVTVIQRTLRGWIPTVGLAVLSDTGELLALVDDRGWGSAWGGGHGPIEDLGVEVTTEPMGCAVIDAPCAFSVPLGLRFSHGDAAVLVPPGQSRELITSIGTFIAVNAWAEDLAEVSCTDTGPLLAWALLARRE